MKQTEATGANRSSSSSSSSEAGDISSTVVSAVMMENLRMEKLLAACYQVSSAACN